MEVLGASDLMAKLEAYPHSFHLVELKTLNVKKRQNILDRIQSEKCLNYLSEMDRNRNENFISFLLYLTKRDISEAYDVNRKVRERDETNIVAQANHVRFLIEKASMVEANEHYKKLKDSKNSSGYNRSHAVAEAEIAYCLSRMSPKFYYKAVQIFKSVNEKYPEEYLWKYGEAITRIRCISPSCYTIDPQHDIEANIVRCSQLLLEITTCNDYQLCAKAWVELGQLNNYIENAVVPIDENVLKQVKEKVEVIPWENCFEKALEICSTDHIVLQLCGKYFRYSGKLDRAKECLEKAIQIHPTAFSHHHMALTLKKMAENAVRNKTHEQKYRSRWSDPQNYCSFPRPQKHNSFASQDHGQSRSHSGHPSFSSHSTPTTRQAFKWRGGQAFKWRGRPNNQLDKVGRRSHETSDMDRQRGHHTAGGRKHDENLYQGSSDRESFVYHATNQNIGHDGQKQQVQNASVSDGTTTASCSRDAHSPSTTTDSEISLDSKIAAMSLSETFLNQQHADNSCSQIKANCSINKRIQLYLKSQKPKVALSKDDPLIKQAIYHLNKSLEITHGCNMKALLDLGTIYVQLGDNENAEKSFKMVIMGCENGSPLDLVTAYEELGLCYARMSENALELSKDMHCYLTLAIQKAADIVAKIPCLQMTGFEKRHGFKTLSMLLKNKYHKSKDKTILKELAHLYELVGKYGENLDFYKEILRLDGKEAENIEFWKSVIKSYLLHDDYNNAVTILSLLHCTTQASDVPSDLVHEVYIKTARHHLKNSPPEQAHCYLKYVFSYKFGTRCEEEDGVFDIMILYDEEDDSVHEVSSHIKGILQKYTGLAITENVDDGFSAKLDISNYEEIMQTSKVIVVVLGPRKTSRGMKQRIGMATTLNNTDQKTVVCVTTKDHHSVLALAMFTHLPAPVSEPAAADEHTDWILQFFSLILDDDSSVS